MEGPRTLSPLGCAAEHSDLQFCHHRPRERLRVEFMAQGAWSPAAAACRRAMEADRPNMCPEILRFCRRVCSGAGPPTSLQAALAQAPVFAAFRAGWLEVAAQPGAQATTIMNVARGRVPSTHDVLQAHLHVINIAESWQRLVKSCVETDVGLRCLGAYVPASRRSMKDVAELL